MARFKDNLDDEWDLVLTVGILGKLRTEAGLDLRAADAGQQVAGLDPYSEQFGRILWLLVEKQAAERNIEPDDFPFRLDGNALEGATEALVDALIDFFPNARSRQIARAKLPELRAKAEKELEATMDRELSKLLAGTSPASPASTPTT